MSSVSGEAGLVAAVMAVIAVGVVGCSSPTDILMDQRGEVGPDATSKEQRFTVKVTDSKLAIGVSAKARLKSGKVSVRLLGPGGDSLFEADLDAEKSSHAGVLESIARQTDVQVVVAFTEAVGTWHVTVVHVSPNTALAVSLTSGLLVLVLVFAVVWVTRRRIKVRFRWLWVGAGVWTVAVALKVVSSVLTMKAVMAALKAAVPHGLFVLLGSLYVGLHSAVFEIGLTILAAWLWRQLTASPERAVTIGIGAGAFEAALIGLAAIGGGVAVLAGNEQALVALAHQVASTPLAWLIAAVERGLTIPLHIASRVLVFHGFAHKRRLPVVLGFVLFALIDTVGGGVHVAELVGRISMWWIELSFVPFAVFSLYLIRWVVLHWRSGGEEVVGASS